MSDQKFDSEEFIEIISSDSEQANAPNEQIFNTSYQEISTDSDNGQNNSNQTILLSTDDSEDSNTGNEAKLNMCQKLYPSQTQATPELFGSDTDTKVKNTGSSSRNSIKTSIDQMDEPEIPRSLLGNLLAFMTSHL